MRSATSFERDADLIVIRAIVVGPTRCTEANLILDTGAGLTTLSPRLGAYVGFTPEHSIRRSITRTAAGFERGYIVRAPAITALGITLADVNVNIADLTDEVEGLLGMSFLNELDYEIRSAAQRIYAARAA